MNKKLDIHNFWRSNIFIILTFAIMSVMSGILMYHSHLIGTEWDLTFHWQRIYEIRDSISNGNLFPIVSLNRFNQSGSAVMSMYPEINLFPAVFLSFIIKSSVAMFNVLFILRNLCDLLISYYSSFNFTKDRKISFVFSIAYVFTTMSMYYYFGVSALGTMSVISYLPLVLFGFLMLLKENKWVELTLGMIMIIFSHVLSTGIVILFLLVLLLINVRSFRNCKRIESLINSIVVTAIATSIFWISFLIFSFNNKMNIPSALGIEGYPFSRFIFNGLDNSISDSIGIVGIIGIILGAVNYKKMKKYSKQMFWVAILFILVASDIFPWSIVAHTFMIHLQSASRLYVIPQIILCYLFAECVASMTRKIKKQRLILVLISISILIVQMGAQETLVNNYYNRPELIGNDYNVNSVIKTNKEFNNALSSNTSSTIYNDYYPTSSMIKNENLNNHIANYDSNKVMSVKLLGNGMFIFNSPKNIKKLSLPFLYYHGIDYQVKLDGKTIKGYPNKNALMTISNVRKGKHHVQIIVHKTKAEIASYILSLIGLLILLGTILKNFLKKRKI